MDTKKCAFRQPTLLAVIGVLVVGVSFAQQVPHYSQYLQNHFLINPAVAGIESYADARVGYRQQWGGLEDAPRTFYLTAHLPLGNPDFSVEPASTPRFRFGRERYSSLPDAHGGAGLTVVRDQTGPWTRFSMGATGAYHYPVNEEWQVSLGLMAGLSQHTLDFDQIRLANSQDPLVSSGKLSVIRPDLNTGVWVYSTDFFGGFSVNQLWHSTLSFKNSSSNWQGKVVPHFFLTAGYRLPLVEDWDFTPSILLKKVLNAPLSWDLNLKMSYSSDLWFGASYRKLESFTAFFGAKVAQQLRVNYTYEYPISSLQVATRGSHEITLGVTLGSRSHYTSSRLFW